MGVPGVLNQAVVDDDTIYVLGPDNRIIYPLDGFDQAPKFKRKKKNGGVMRRMKDKLSCLAPPRNKKKNM
jgi:hypothetical protein